MLAICPILFGTLLISLIFALAYLFDFLGFDKSHLNTWIIIISAITTAFSFKIQKKRRFYPFEYAIVLASCIMVNILINIIFIFISGSSDMIHGRIGGILLILALQSVAIALGLAPFKRKSCSSASA